MIVNKKRKSLSLPKVTLVKGEIVVNKTILFYTLPPFSGMGNFPCRADFPA